MALLFISAASCPAATRLFIPVFTEPAPAQIERDIRIVDADSGEELGTMLPRVNIRWTAMVNGGSLLFFGPGAIEGLNGLVMYGVRTGTVEVIETPLSYPNLLIPDENSGKLYAADTLAGLIAVLDLSTMEVIRVLDFTEMPFKTFAVDSSRDRLYLALGDELRVVNSITSEVHDTQTVMPALDDVLFDPIRDRIYYTNTTGRLGVADISDNGIEPYATVEFDRRLESILLDSTGARLYASATGNVATDGIYMIEIDLIPPGASDSETIEAEFLDLPRAAPLMDFDPESGLLYLVQDLEATPGPPPSPPGDPMTIFILDTDVFEIQRTIETDLGGAAPQGGSFLTRVPGPDGVIDSRPVPALQSAGVWILLLAISAIGLMTVRIRARDGTHR